MIESRFEIASSLEQKIPQIIEAFVKFYGEEERKNIEERLGNTKFLGYLTIRGYSNLENKVIEEARIKASKEFFKLKGIEYSEEKAKKLFSFSGFASYSDNYKKFYENYGIDKSWAKSSVQSALEEKFDIKNLKENSSLYQECCNKMLADKEYYDQAKKVYEEVLEKYKTYTDYGKNLQQLKSKIEEKYTIKYLHEIEEFLSNKDKEQIGKVKYSTYFECNEILISYDYSSKTLLDAFSDESEEQLKNPQTREFIKDNIKNDRINYFKKVGLDLGDDYDTYVSCGYIEKYIPNKNMMDKVFAARKRVKSEQDRELLHSIPHINTLREKVKELNLGTANTEFDKNIFNESTCICPNFRIIDGKIIPYALMYISGDTSEDVVDCRIIHECNHIYEMGVSVENNEMIFNCGWDNGREQIMTEENQEDELNDDREKRPYELLNEIINELLAQDITRIMHDSGVYLYSNKEKNRGTSGSSYQYAARLVINFYNEFKDIIIQSRKNNNIETLFNEVGKENFMELNKLVYDYLKYFDGFKIYNTVITLNNGESNSDTEFYIVSTQKANEIFEKMKNYKLENGRKL